LGVHRNIQIQDDRKEKKAGKTNEKKGVNPPTLQDRVTYRPTRNGEGVAKDGGTEKRTSSGPKETSHRDLSSPHKKSQPWGSGVGGKKKKKGYCPGIPRKNEGENSKRRRSQPEKKGEKRVKKSQKKKVGRRETGVES